MSDDLDQYSELVGDPDVMRYLGGALSPQQARSYISRAKRVEDEHGYSRYAVIYQNQLIGMCGFAPVKDYIDFGYRYKKKYWGFGFAVEAGSAVIAKTIDAHNFQQIVGLTHPENIGSIRVLEKLRFQYVCDETTPTGMDAKRYHLCVS